MSTFSSLPKTLRRFALNYLTKDTDTPRSRSTPRSWMEVAIAVSVLANVVLVLSDFGLAYMQSSRYPWKGTKPIYNPVVDEAIRHERVVWPSIEHKTVYHGPPTDETDQVWDNLYVPYGISMIKGWQNKKLWKQTAPEPLAVDGYKVSIDVTHYIHCLNFLRVLAWPERYSGAPPNRFALVGTAPVDHIDHCLNVIRVSMMCNANLSPAVWQYNADSQRAEVRRDTMHTCRNYEEFEKWAETHAVPYELGSDNFNMTMSHHEMPTHEQLVEAGLVADKRTLTEKDAPL